MINEFLYVYGSHKLYSDLYLWRDKIEQMPNVATYF